MIAILTYGNNQTPRLEFFTDHTEGDAAIANRISDHPYGELRAFLIDGLQSAPILITEYGKGR